MNLLGAYAKIFPWIPYEITGFTYKVNSSIRNNNDGISYGMDEDSQKMLKDTYELARENNKMLRGIRRSQNIASFMRLVYWLIIIGITAGSFYFLQPYLNKAISLYNSVSGMQQKFNPSNSDISNLLKKLGN